MKNIFKDTYFGKVFRTRDGRKAIYHMYDSFEDTHFLILDGSDEVCCNDEGIDLGDAPEYDIISEWEDPQITEEKYEALKHGIEPQYVDLAEKFLDFIVAQKFYGYDPVIGIALWLKNNALHYCIDTSNDDELKEIAFNHYCKECRYCKEANAKTIVEKYNACQNSDCYRKNHVWKLINGFIAGYHKAKGE